MLGYVQLVLEECDENQILELLLALEEVKEAHILFGEWDALVKVEVTDADAFSEFVLKKVRTIPEVTKTSTMIVAK